MRCGSRILTECPNADCGVPLPPNDHPVEGEEYLGYCPACGHAYPWRERAVQRAKRTLEELAEVEDWNEAAKERALELVDEIATDTATASLIETRLAWLSQRGAEAAKSVIIELVKSIATDGLKAILKAKGLLP